MSEKRPDLELREVFDALGFVTRSPRLAPLLLRARKAAEVSDITVLIEGETGTGKQVLAQGIHGLDRKRRAFPFVTVHCSTISEGLAESELFGHQRGAFSGAVSDRKGLFQAAQHGSILLDDINDLPLGLQVKLLDVIQRGMVRSVGSDREIRLDVRVIAACNQPLEPMIREGRFRADLFHRLNVVKFSLPPLRERVEDFESIMLSLSRRHGRLYGPIESVDGALLDHLATRLFPGNIRELENAVQRMLFVKTEGSSLRLEDWMAQTQPEEPESAPPDLLTQAANAMWSLIQSGVSWEDALQQIERRVLQAAIEVGGCTRRETAQRLQTSERTLYHKMRAYGLGRSNGVAAAAASATAI